MKLREIHIQKFRSLENLQLSFENALGDVQPLTVLAGPNGSGKTSILFAIIQALRGITKYRTDDVPEPSDADIRRGENGGIFSTTPPQISVRLQVEFSEDEKQAIREVWQLTEMSKKEPVGLAKESIGYTTSFPSNSKIEQTETLPDWSGTLTTVDWKYPPRLGFDGERRPSWFVESVTPREAMHWFEGRLRAIRGIRKGALKDPSLIDRIGGPMIFPQDRSLRNRVAGVGSGGGESELTVWEILKDLGQRANSATPTGEPEYTVLKESARKSEERIKKLFAQICGPKEYVGFAYTSTDTLGSPYFKDGNSVYPLSMASSGEQVILEYIVRLTFPNTLNRGMVLIDEPEIHLHPRWIRQLYRALTQLGEGNQFIVTTHSAELRSMAAEDGVLIELGSLDT